MQLLTIVERYVTAAMQRAESERLEDGTIAATIPGCPGVVAFGADQHECATALYALLEDWVKASLTAGSGLPVFDGIDLNTKAAHVLSSYHDRRTNPPQGHFYADETELEAAFDERSRPRS